MTEKMFSLIIQLVIGFAVVGVLFTFCFWWMGRIRASSLQKEPGPEEILRNFAEMNSQGVLDGEEFRIIKRRLSSQINERGQGEPEESP